MIQQWKSNYISLQPSIKKLGFMINYVILLYDCKPMTNVCITSVTNDSRTLLGPGTELRYICSTNQNAPILSKYGKINPS